MFSPMVAVSLALEFKIRALDTCERMSLEMGPAIYN